MASRNKFWQITRYIIAAFLACSISYYLFDNWVNIKALVRVRLIYALFLMPVMSLSFVFLSANLFVLLKHRHPELKWASWFKYHIIKRFMNMHLPQSGNIYEAIKTKERFGVNLYNFTSSLGAVNLFAACFNCLISIIFLVILGAITNSYSQTLILSLAFILLLLVTIPLFLEIIFIHLGKFAFSEGIINILEKAHAIVINMKKDLLRQEIIFRLILWNTFFFINSAFTIYLGFRALDLHVSLNSLIPFVILNTIVGLVTILPSNIGLIEYSYGVVGTYINLPLGVGILLSIFFRLMAYIVFMAIFIVFWVNNKLVEKR